MTEDFIKVSDIVITDYSAISAVAAFLNKQLYFYVPDLDEYSEIQGLNIDIRKEFTNICITDVHNFKKIFSNIKTIQNDIKFDCDFFYKLSGSYTEKISETIIKGFVR